MREVLGTEGWDKRKEGGKRRYGARREWRKEGCMRQRGEKEGGYRVRKSKEREGGGRYGVRTEEGYKVPYIFR